MNRIKLKPQLIFTDFNKFPVYVLFFCSQGFIINILFCDQLINEVSYHPDSLKSYIF